MKKRLLQLLCSLLAAVFLLSPFLVFAEGENPEAPPSPSPDSPPEVASTGAVVYNLESASLVYRKNENSRINPAAFTKLMTALLAFEYASEHGNPTVTVTEEMLSAAGGTSMRLKAGEIIPFDSLLKGLVVQNANDAALVIASVVGGNIASFVEKMNERAHTLGMEHSYYANPTGVDSSVMYTTLEDTVKLCTALYRVNDFMLMSEIPKVSIPATNLTEERVYTNKNALVPYSYVTDYYMKGVRGMVAGYTSVAGYCVATVRKKNNATFFVLVTGGVDRSEEKNQRDISSYRDAKALLEWSEACFAIRKAIPDQKVICEKAVRLSSGVDHMILVSGEELEALLPIGIDLESAIRYEIHTEKDTYTAPIIEGKSYGTLDLFYEDRLLGTVPLVAQSNIGLSRWLVMWDAVTGFFSQGPARVVLILIIAAAVLYVLILIGTVWVQYMRRTRARRIAINEINEQENRRMRKVRLEERKASRERRRRVSGALRESFRVLSGDAEVLDTPQRKKRTPPSKAVAKVPEKYRKNPTPTSSRPTPQNGKNPSSSGTRPKNGTPNGERYRVTVHKPSPSPKNAPPRGAAQKPPSSGGRSPSRTNPNHRRPQNPSNN